MKWVRAWLLFLAASFGTIASAQQLVDLNNASSRDLQTLPGIGEKLAEDIIENRPYQDLNELLKIPRFGKGRLEKIKDLVTFEPMREQSANPSPAKGASASPTSSAPTFQAPSGMKTMECWRCQERFCVDSSAHEGVCPYCGVHWNTKGASP